MEEMETENFKRLWIDLKDSKRRVPWEETAKSGTERLCAPTSCIIPQSFNLVGHVIRDRNERFETARPGWKSQNQVLSDSAHIQCHSAKFQLSQPRNKRADRKNSIVAQLQKTQRMDGRLDERTPDPFYNAISVRWPTNSAERTPSGHLSDRDGHFCDGETKEHVQMSPQKNLKFWASPAPGKLSSWRLCGLRSSIILPSFSSIGYGV